MRLLAIGSFTVASGLLVVSGLTKVLQPGRVAGAMGTLGLRLPRWSGRVLGVGETGLGLAALLVGGRLPALLVGLAYASFVVVVVLMMRRGESVSCGCFGALESPPSAIHVGFDLAACGAALSVAATGGWGGIAAFASDLPGGLAVYGALVALGVAAALAALTVLPEVAQVTRTLRNAADERHGRAHAGHDHGPATLQISGRP